MLFNSIEYQLFFPIVIILYFLIPMKYTRAKQIWLLIASYYFYMSWNARHIVLIFISTLLTYICGIVLDAISNGGQDEARKTARKKLTVAACFIVNLGILFWFKYTNFFFETVESVLNSVGMGISAPRFDILLPVGISFYTLQALGYIVDVYRGDVKARKDFLQYALFVSFFPQLVAGPIERTKNLMDQLNVSHKFKFENLREGVLLMIWGYFLKIVIADRIAIYVDTVYGDIDTYNGAFFVLAILLFSFQVYCDFYGYSVIAKGSAKVLGIDLMDNFKSPFLSENIGTLWRNWHISLSSWFKDYLYIPLGGSRRGKVRKYLNLMIVNIASGLWHGANITYVVWGGLNGLFNVVGDITLPFRKKVAEILHVNTKTAFHRFWQILITYLLFAFSVCFFRAETLTQAVTGLRGAFTSGNYSILSDGSIFNCGLDRSNFLVMLVGVIVLMVVDGINKKGILVRKIILKQYMPIRIAIISLSILLILVFGLYGPGYDRANFIYFRF